MGIELSALAEEHTKTYKASITSSRFDFDTGSSLNCVRALIIRMKGWQLIIAPFALVSFPVLYD